MQPTNTIPQSARRTARCRYLVPLAGACALLLATSCSKPGQEVVAEVNGHKITAADMILQYRSMSVPVRPFVDTLEGKRGFLTDLINKELMLEEARARKLDQSPEVERALEQIEDGLLAERYYQIHVRDKVQVSDAELRDLYDKMGEEARLRLIVVPTEQQAREIQQALAGGADFATLARERSVDPTSTRGGDMDFHPWADYADPLTKAARPLEPGQVSAPIALESGFALVMLEARRPTTLGSFDSERNNLTLKLRAIKETALARAWSAEKRAGADIQVNPGTLSVLSQKMVEATRKRTKIAGQAPLELTDQERELPLVTFTGHSWTLGDYMGRLALIPVERRPKLTASPPELQDFIANLVVRELAVEESREAGLAEDPQVKSQLDRNRERLMVGKLHGEIAKVDSIPEDESRRYYEEHRASLIAPARARIMQAVLPTEKEARQWRGRIARGETTLKQVAEKESLDRESAAAGGETDWIVRSPSPTALEKAVFAAEANRMGGPVRTEQGWVIFRVIEKEGEAQMTYDEARRAIEKQLIEEKRTRLFDDWLAERREGSRIRIDEQALGKVDFGTAPRPDLEQEGGGEPTPVTSS